MPAKNTPPGHVRNRTSDGKRPGTSDRRVQKTKTALHDALIGLAREKSYPTIAVKEILERANVGRSTFYTHFRDKDDLLDSGIREMLTAIHRAPRPRDPVERIVVFSLPVLEHIDQHRRTAGPGMGRSGRRSMHLHLEDMLTALVADELACLTRWPHGERVRGLVARHVASTFVLVLNWWVENEGNLTPADANARFRDLVMPSLAQLLDNAR